jgi:hypothetical protein
MSGHCLLHGDRAAGGHDGREDGRDVAHSQGRDTGRCGERSAGAGGRRSAGTGRCRGPAAGPRADAEQLGEHREWPDRGSQRGDLAALVSHLGAARPAARTVAQVTARHPAWPHALLVSFGQLMTDFDTSGVSCLERLREADPCSDQQRLDGGH